MHERVDAQYIRALSGLGFRLRGKEEIVEYIYDGSRKFTCANVVLGRKMRGLLWHCGKRRREYPDNCDACPKYEPMCIKRVQRVASPPGGKG